MNPIEDFSRWLIAHKSGMLVAGLLACAGPMMFFTGALGVLGAAPGPKLIALGLWWMLFGALLWGLLLLGGYLCEHLPRSLGRGARGAFAFLVACTVAGLTNLLTASRAPILIEQGLVYSELTMFAHGFASALVMALLYFAHLNRSGQHQRAVARLAAAQAAQRAARRKTVEARLQEIQARIEPRLLFDLLDKLRRLYARDPSRAERYLDKLIEFLRLALPQLRSAHSSLARELELVIAYVELRSIADPGVPGIKIHVAPEVLHARFPPGVLLPLISKTFRDDSALGRLAASLSDGRCRLQLTLDEMPAQASFALISQLVAELHGDAGRFDVERRAGGATITVEVPYELA